MVIDIAAAAVEIVATVLIAVVDIAVLVLVASIRPWRYVLSPEYRAATSKELAGRHPLYRALYLAWGSIALVASIGVIVGAWWLISSH